MGLIVHWNMKKGDLGPNLSGTVTNADGTPIDLTGCTIAFRMTDELDNVKINNAPASFVGSPVTGRVEYLWQAADTNAVGDFRGVFKITLPTGKPLSSPSKDFVAVHIEP